jgi:hypothetical protein
VTELVLPALVAAAALTFTYLFCIGPMRKGRHCGMPGMSRPGGLSDTDAAEIQRLRAEVAGLRREQSIEAPESSPSAAGPNATVRKSR